MRTTYLVIALVTIVSLCRTQPARAEAPQPRIFARGWAWVTALGAAPPGFQHVERQELVPDPPYRRFAPPATVTARRTGVGSYVVRFPHLAVRGGTAHVTAYSGNHHCKVTGWSPSGDAMDVGVACFDGAGRTDGSFTAMFYKDGNAKDPAYANAYLWADQPDNDAWYEPSQEFQFNSRRTVNRVRRLSAGEYLVELPLLGSRDALVDKGGHPQVTAYGPGPERCKVRNWYDGGTAMFVRIGCSSTGGPSDSRFTLTFTSDPGILANSIAEAKVEGAYVWANRAPRPAAFYQSDSYGGARVLLDGPETGLAVGQYRVHLPAWLDPEHAGVSVTAYGADDAHCTIAGWGRHPAGQATIVDVRCHAAPGGAARNAPFNLLFVTGTPILH